MPNLMPAPPDISIILPALTMSNDYVRCLSSIRAALQSKVDYEIVSIVRDIDAFSGVKNSDLCLLQEDGPGIYRAMNFGLEHATGKYLYFIGQDDILLPDSSKAIIQGITNEADVILANVFWGDRRIHRNYAISQSLVWTNWCHQGVFYRRATFLQNVRSFPVKYKAQADHYSNIILSTNPQVKITKYHGCVAWYSATGFSTQSPDLAFRADFPGLVREHFGFFSYAALTLKRALLSCFRLIWKNK